MKIETIYVLERMNKGNYEHIEMSATAKIEEGEDSTAAMLRLKDAVHNALYGTVNKTIIKEETVAEEVKEEKVTKKKATKQTKEEKVLEAAVDKVEDSFKGQDIPEVIKEEPKAKKAKGMAYDSTIPGHKSIFGGYLAKKYNTAWKTVKPTDEIKEFTASLNGKDFLDANGNILDSFLDLVHGFFGA